MSKLRDDAGFSLVEMLIAIGLLLAVSSIVTSALMQMTKQQQTIWNRTEMHSGVRGATELLQQEVGQAGRVALPAHVWVSANPVTGIAATATACTVATITLASDLVPANPLKGVWYDATTNTGILLTFLDADNTESVRVTGMNTGSSQVTGCFWHNHAAGAQGVGAPVVALGAFANGIVPPTGVVNGSTANKLKLYGDINGDGNMVYVEYYCDNGDPGTTGSFNLYRNVMAFDAVSKPAVDNSKILLTNIHPNPADASGTARPCFQYQTASMLVQGTTFTFVLDVAVTLTAWTEQVDPVTRRYQTETKALLNVSPRNVFNAWSLASIGYTDRIQSTPATVTALLP
ncbi:MAG TPA: prepilin-type N-terminal cleavage/methylation domain-containing protein [Vicinamibacterales bacterium]|jgi:prepilin-type N-terminal cleavage/methylation domain-containing protein|nr:prepilin-type N-terminal cleavage/methylation domain-containing protein [Vicinamibacterales bacterium]